MTVNFDHTVEIDVHVTADVSPVEPDVGTGVSVEVRVFLGPFKDGGKQVEITDLLNEKTLQAMREKAHMDADDNAEADADARADADYDDAWERDE